MHIQAQYTWHINLLIEYCTFKLFWQPMAHVHLFWHINWSILFRIPLYGIPYYFLLHLKHVSFTAIFGILTFISINCNSIWISNMNFIKHTYSIVLTWIPTHKYLLKCKQTYIQSFILPYIDKAYTHNTCIHENIHTVKAIFQ